MLCYRIRADDQWNICLKAKNASRPTGFEPVTFDIPYGRFNTLRHCDTQGLRANNGKIRFSLGVRSGMKWVNEWDIKLPAFNAIFVTLPRSSLLAHSIG